MKKIKIPYRYINEYQKVDINELRPKDSYKNLLKKRTHSIDSLVKKYGSIPKDLLIEKTCSTCNSSNYTLFYKKDYMNIVKCEECSLVYTNPIFDEEHYKKTYKSEDYQEIVRELGEESHLYRVQRFGTERIGIMNKFIKTKETIKYLDIGCSTGFVVEAAKNKGWDAVGIDLNPSAINYGISRGLNLKNNSLDEVSFKKNTFDAISLFDVIEHLPNPQNIISKALNYLKTGGILFIYVPNWDSASRFLLGKKAHFIWPTHHLNYYNPKTITDLIQKFELEVEHLVTEGLDIIDYIWHQKTVEGVETQALESISDKLQFFINAGGYGKNLRLIARKI